MKRDAIIVHPPETASAAPSDDPIGLEPASLFSEILDCMLAPLLLIWPMSIVITYFVAASIANAPFDRALEQRAIALGQQIHPDNAIQALAIAPTPAASVRGRPREHVVEQVRGSHGDLLSGDPDLPAPPDAEPASPGLVQFRNITFHGEQIRVAYLAVVGDDPLGSHALVQVGETLGNRSELANEIIKGVILPQFVILPVAVILAWLGLSRGVRSLVRLQQRIAARRPDDMRPIDLREAPSELTPLVLAFNQMLERLEGNIIDQKRFIADAAHQMRTPLAGLRTQAELALRETDPDELKRGLLQLVRSSKRATRLVNQLLALAHAETSANGDSGFDTLDLEALARDAVRDLVPTALERGLDLGFEGAGEVLLIKGHPVLLRELLKNLLDNALRYTPAGGRVTVRVIPLWTESKVALEVEDNGPGIEEEQRELVFERFHRVLGQDADGSGLGLAIVREIARQHSALVTLRAARAANEEGAPGIIFRLTLASERCPPGLQDF